MTCKIVKNLYINFFQRHKIFYHIYYLHDKVMDLILDIFSSKLLHGSLDRSLTNDFSSPRETGQEIPSQDSLPCWKFSVTRLYSKQRELCLHYLNNISFNTISPSTASFLKLSLILGFYSWNVVSSSHFPHVCYMFCPPHLPWLDLLNTCYWAKIIMKDLIMQFTPSSCYLIILS